jgi:hypothetical protein
MHAEFGEGNHLKGGVRVKARTGDWKIMLRGISGK